MDGQTKQAAPRLHLCQTCRAEYLEGMKFCPNCGASAALEEKPLIPTGENRKRLVRRRRICALVAAAVAVAAGVALRLLLNLN